MTPEAVASNLSEPLHPLEGVKTIGSQASVPGGSDSLGQESLSGKWEGFSRDFGKQPGLGITTHRNWSEVNYWESPYWFHRTWSREAGKEAESWDTQPITWSEIGINYRAQRPFESASCKLISAPSLPASGEARGGGWLEGHWTKLRKLKISF